MIVVHGSALTSAEPRDIDVAHTGPWTPAMERAVRDWAAARGLPDLPLDINEAETGQRGQVAIPVPCDPALARFTVLDGAGPNLVRLWVWRDFSSGLRAYGSTVDGFLARMDEGEFGGQVSLLPAEERPDYGEKFGVPWDKYCAGLVALRSAVQHAPAWGEICARLDGGELLARLVAGQEPTRNWRAWPNAPDGVSGHQDGWSQAVSLRVSAGRGWTVAGREFADTDAAAEWLDLR
jgi:hypothetical protein